MSACFQKCRLCLKLGEFCSIFDQDESVKLSEMVMSFANVQIHEGDGLSDRVCTSCIENLSTAYLFKQQCERIDYLLRKSPDVNIKSPPNANYDDFFNQEFHIHTELNDLKDDNEDNGFINTSSDQPLTKHHEISDETDDSDVDSIKCVGCSQSYSTKGMHTCKTTCTIEQNDLQRSCSDETLIANDCTQNMSSTPVTPTSPRSSFVNVSCVLCTKKYDQYDDYVIHINECTMNVKLQHFVCPICHEMYTEKLLYLKHLRITHFINNSPKTSITDNGEDCVDFPIYSKAKPKSARRQIGWSVEDIYQEIDFKPAEQKSTPTSSPLKNFFSKLGNE